MRIYNMPRQSGKTTMLIEWLATSGDHYLIVHSNAEAHRLKRDHPLLEDRILPVYSLISGHLRGMRNATIAIDNLDLVLPQLISMAIDIGPITYTGDYSYGN